MSDGIVRICNLHGHELRLIGSHLVCPHGHECDVDWHVKTLPWADPRVGLCPIHRERLSGARAILDCPQGHQCSTRDSDRPAGSLAPLPQPPQKEPVTMPVPKNLQPHGTAKRYWQGCKCEPCKKAVNTYVRQKKAEKVTGVRTSSGPPLVSSTAVARRAVPVRPRAVIPTPDAVAGLRVVVGEVAGLRQQLAEAEQRFAAVVSKLMPNWKLIPSAGDAVVEVRPGVRRAQAAS